MPKGDSRPLQGRMMNSFKYRNIRKRFLHARPIYGWEKMMNLKTNDAALKAAVPTWTEYLKVLPIQTFFLW